MKQAVKKEREILYINPDGIDDDFDIYPEGKTSQKAKGQFSKYKAGGGLRSTKKH